MNLQTKTWRTINEDATIEVYNGNVYLMYEWYVDVFDLDKWKGQSIAYLGKRLSHMNTIGDCVSVVAENGQTLLVGEKFLVNDYLVLNAYAVILYRWNNQIFKIGLFDLCVDETKLYHFSSMVAPFAFQNFIFFQCQNRESFVYDIDTNTMQQIVGDTEYRYTTQRLYSISDHIYLY